MFVCVHQDPFEKSKEASSSSKSSSAVIAASASALHLDYVNQSSCDPKGRRDYSSSSGPFCEVVQYKEEPGNLLRIG